MRNPGLGPLSQIKRSRKHGFLRRKSTKGGRRVLLNRIRKGRTRIAVSHNRSSR